VSSGLWASERCVSGLLGELEGLIVPMRGQMVDTDVPDFLPVVGPLPGQDRV
jgi:hypothetical protein